MALEHKQHAVTVAKRSSVHQPDGLLRLRLRHLGRNRVSADFERHGRVYLLTAARKRDRCSNDRGDDYSHRNLACKLRLRRTERPDSLFEVVEELLSRNRIDDGRLHDEK